MKNQITIIRIATQDNAYSNIDRYVHFFGDVRVEVKECYGYYYKNTFNQTVEILGEMYDILWVTIAPEWMPRNDGFSKEKINEIYSSFLNKGYFDGKPDILKDYQDLDSLKRDINNEKIRFDSEYVLWKSYKKKYEPKEYVGGFSLDIIFEEILISYIERGMVYGYIGHSCRKKWLDVMLSEILLKHIKNEDFACWLTSTDGRHFGDWIEGRVDDNDREWVRDYIIKQIPIIHNKSVIYNHPEHTGTYASTLEIREKLHNLGILMEENNI
jgi:hypothetical protein